VVLAVSRTAAGPWHRGVLAALAFLLRLEVARIAGTGLPGRSDKLFYPDL